MAKTYVNASKNASFKKAASDKAAPKYVNASKALRGKNQGGLPGTIGYIAGRAGTDFLRVGEGVVDAALVPVDLLTGNVDRAKSRFMGSPVDAMRERLDREYNPGKVAGFIGDIAGGIGQSVGYGLISAIPYAGTPMMYSSIVEQSISSAAEKTGEVGWKEVGYGTTAGAVEGLLESKLGAGVSAAKGIGSAILKKTGLNVAESAAKAGGKSLLKTLAIDTAKGFAGEFGEEFISEAVDPKLQNIWGIDKDARLSLKDSFRAGIVGGISGGAISIGPSAINYKSAVSVGRALQESGLDGDLIKRAKYTLSVLEAAQTRSTGQIKGKPEGDTKETAKEWLSRTAENRKVKRLSKETAQLADKIRRNIQAYETSMADPAMAQSEPVAALLGELRGNLFLVGYAYEADVIEQVMMDATDEQRQAFVDAINEELAAQGKKHDYTLADFDANKDDIRRGLAGLLMADEMQGYTAKYGAEVTESPEEPAQDPKDTTAEQVTAQEENAATEDLSGIEEEVWRAVTDETVKGYGTQNEQEVALLRAAVSQNVPEKSIPLMLERFREGTDMTPAEFADAWADGVLLFGRLGLNEKKISQESALSRMSEKARRASIEYGKWLSEEQRSKEQEAAKKKKRPVKEGESRKPKGEVVRHPGINLKADLDDAQFTAYKAAEIMAPALKADIEIHKGLERNGKQVNGYYDTKTNTIHINIDAVRDGKHIALYTLGHEVAHYIKAWSPKKFYELGDYVMDQLGEKAEKAVRDKLNFIKRNGLVDGLDETEAYDRAYEEVVADGMELVLTDGTVLDALARENKTLWQKIKDRIFEIIDKIKKAYGDLSKTSRTAQILSETMDSLDDIEQLFYEGVTEAGERTRTAEVETRTEGGKVYSFAGEKANAANVETLSEAKRRIEAGEDAETVRQETGWFQGYDGKWRFEIDDSEAIFFSSGDARFSKNHPEYAEHSALTLKFILGDITPEELDRLKELGRTWGNEKRRLADRLKGGGATLEDILQHNKLFEAYPELREVRVVVEDMDVTEKGRYTKRTNTITISSKLSAKEARKTLAHEVQHKIQEIEGFALGASSEYWARRENERSRENLDVIDQEIQYFDQKLRQMEKESGYEEFEQEVFERAMNGDISEEQYDAEIDKFMEEHPDLKKATQHMENLRRIRGETARRERIEDPSLLYRRTAGEVEARDVEQRIDMTEDKRKNTRPDIDRENVVFAEERMYSIDEEPDTAYLAAVERGDMETAQRMVDEAAKAAGYTVKAYHGTPINGITVFDNKKIGSTTDEGLFGNGFYFSTNKLTADGYATERGATMPVYLKINKPWWGNAHNDISQVAEEIGVDKSTLTTRKAGKISTVVAPLASYARTFTAHLSENGYDSVVVQHGAYDYEIVIFNNKSIKSADPVTYDDNGNVIPLSERFKEDDSDIRYSIEEDADNETFDTLYDQRAKIQAELNNLEKTKKDIESSDEYNDFVLRIINSSGEESKKAVQDFQNWIQEKDYENISNKVKELSAEYEAVTQRMYNIQAEEGKEKERKAIEKSNLSESDFFKKAAIKEFGYTPFFYDAGYMLPNGKLLNFSGEKGKHFGYRGQDHRAIGIVFEGIKGGKAMVKFMSQGNIRVMGETPGIDIISTKEPTKEQYATIKRFVRESAKEMFFAVDFTDEDGITVGGYSYENNVNADRVVNDIRYFFENRKIREQSHIASFLYSIDDTPETPDVSDSAFDEVLRRAGLSHLVEETAETENTETAPPPRKAPRERDPEEVRRDRIRAHETLANALMEAAQNEHEYRLVKNYQMKAAELADAEVRKEDLRKKTAEVNREIDALQDKLKGVDKTKREPWVMTALTDAQKRKGELLDEMDALDEKLRTETDKLLSLASAKQLRKLIRAERSKAAAMERSAERARQREMDSKEWAKETVKKAREESEEKVKKARQEAQDYKAAVYKTSMEKVYKARREATDYKRAVYRTAFAKADEKNQKYRDKLDEMAKQSMERREITSRKRAVQRILGTLNTMLYHPNRQKHVPEELRGLTETVLASADPKKFAVNRDHIREMSDLAAKIERLERKVARTAEEQKSLEKMKSKYEHLENETISVKRQAEALLVAFKKYQSSVTTGTGFDQALIDKMTADVERIEEASLKEMTLESLKAVENFYTMLKHQIDEQNNLFMQGKEARVSDFGNNATTEAHDAKSLKFLSPKAMELKGMANVRQFFWKNMKPLTVFEAIGSDTFTRLFQSVLNGENVWARDIEEARKKIVETRDKYGYDKWELDKRTEIKDKDGKTVRLSLSEMMSLYAYAKRKQAMGHLEGGGFVLDPGATEMAKGKVISFADMERRLNHAERHVVDQMIIGEIASKLTAEQKAYVDEMQTYLTKLGERGNTVSRKLYGIDIFTEEYYFPIKVKSEYLESHTGRTGDPNIKNRGMTKEVTPEADNPLVLQGFDDVMVDHIVSMATYHAFVLPVEDLTRVLNYKPSNAKIDEDGNWTVDESRKDYSTLKAVIEEKYGAEANHYIEQLIRDLNGGARRDAAATLLDKGITGFKRASTMASLSVLIQQPTSLIRAAAYIDPKYLFGQASIVDFANHKKLWERLCKYAPVGIIKEMGGYDTGVGARTGDYLNAKNYKTPQEKLEAFFKPERFGGDANYRAEVFGKGAAYFDEMAWIQMFEACVYEQADKLGKSRDSEEVLKAAGKRFEEVVRRTQVYDSTLTRTEFMRSKDTGMKMATAFMAEPSTIVSMVADAIMKAERGDTAFLRRTAGAVAGAVIINALASSLVYAMRDDDEEKTYGEKYVASVAMEAAEAINPLEYLPYFRDIMSIMKGYEIERTDMTLISNLFQQVELLTNSKRTVGEKVLGVSGAVSAFFGIPVTNLTRDAKGIVNTVMGGVDTERGTAKGMSAALKEEFTGIFGLFDEQTKNEYQIYQAYVSGDTAHYNRVKARYKSDQAAEMALRQALRDNDPRISEAAEAKHSGDLAVYESLVDQIESEGIFERNIVIRAINNEVSELKRAAEKGELVPKDETATDEETAESLYTASDLNAALERGDNEDFAAIMAALVQDKVSTGKTEAQAKASVKSSITAYWKKQYLSGYQDTETRKRIIAILTETGLYGSRNDVATMCEGWVKASK